METLTAKELQVIQSSFWGDENQGEAALRLGTTDAYFSRVKHKALRKLREAMA